MSELNELINKIFLNEIKKAVISKPVSKQGEFKKITWASSKSTFKNFGIVMTIVIISAVVIGFIDWGLGSFFDFLLNVLPDIG